jgi:hypothetical protein
MKALICWLFGHRMEYHEFVFATIPVCTRCGRSW